MANWGVYTYDVWGNKKDGYEVNDVFRTGEVVDIPEVVLNSDKALFTWLKKVEFIKKGVQKRHVEFGGDPYSDTITIDYKGKPDCELRRKK